jgi:hypothetical protein
MHALCMGMAWRGRHAELVAVGVGHDDPGDVGLLVTVDGQGDGSTVVG